ncbi:MAG TPA: arylsulfotransferase family protein [Candidatus Polarisedimenticolia bacterium]|nr:arylsulfotransferase family protein [Candidatus Polarisedimenticolia bacterium]
MQRLSWRYLAVVLLMFAAFAYGYLVHRNQLPPYAIAFALKDRFLPAQREDPDTADRKPPAGSWERVQKAGGSLSRDNAEELERLRSLGYVAGVEKGPAGDGVVYFSAQSAYPGWNLYCAGHQPEAYLMDMEGRVVHSWRVTFEQAFPGVELKEDAYPNARAVLRAIKLLPDGDLLVIFEGQGIVRLNSSSEIVWSRFNGAHHAVTTWDDGNIYLLTRKAVVLDGIAGGRPILEEFIAVLTPAGDTVRTISLLEALRRSEFALLARQAEETGGDFFHTNDIELLPAGTEFPRGVVRKDPMALISSRSMHALLLVNLATEAVDWVSIGLLERQHDPSLLPNGNLLVFDNRVESVGSRAVEFDPLTHRVVWSYPPSDVPELFSFCCGNAQRLPNGNTLLTFAGPARAIEVTPDGQIAWDFRSPHQTEDGEFVAQLMQLTRLPIDLPTGWAHGGRAE